MVLKFDIFKNSIASSMMYLKKSIVNTFEYVSNDMLTTLCELDAAVFLNGFHILNWSAVLAGRLQMSCIQQPMTMRFYAGIYSVPQKSPR